MSAALQEFEVQIEQMRADHLPQVLEIEKRNYDFPWSPANFTSCMTENYENIVLFQDERMIGYAIMLVIAPECHILNLCVDCPYRRQGYGSLLLESILARAMVLNGHYILLEARPSNTVALKLYDAYHFHEIGRRHRYYPAHSESGYEDALVLMRKL